MSFIYCLRHTISIVFIGILGCLLNTASAQHMTDHDLRKNVEPIEKPLQVLMALQPRIFEYQAGTLKNLNLQQGRQYGFLTDEARKSYAPLLKANYHSYMQGKNSYRQMSYYTVDEGRLLAVLVAAMQAQQKEIEALRAAVQALQKQN